MIEIQRGTTPVIPVRLQNLDDGKEIESVEFVFKARNAEQAPEIVRKKYPGGGVSKEDGAFCLFLTETDTRKLMAFTTMFLGTRIRYKDGTIPYCKTVPVHVDETLFQEVIGE